MEAGMSGLI